MRTAAAHLLDGAVVAVKGIGGYHVACRADDEEVVARLRARKRREEKPFALMVCDVAAARELVALTPEAEAALCGVERPIVLAPRLAGAPVAHAVAPRSAELGVMLPYAPLQHLLLADAGVPLVMTSGNVSDEPIAYRDDDALAPARADRRPVPRPRPADRDANGRLGRSGRPAVLRRSRGFVPRELALPVPAARPVLGCGAELKSTFCLARGGRAWLGHHIGDLTNAETLASYREGVAHLGRAVRRHARGRRTRPAPAVPVHDVRAEHRGRRARRGPAPPRAPRGLPGRARRDGARGGRDLRRRRARPGRHGVGRRDPRRRPALVRPAWRTWRRSGSRAATRRRASRGG